MYKRFIKPTIDVILSLFGLCVCCIPMVMISLAIRIDSKGPVFFRQVRLGKDLEPFTIYKFRTMCDHAFEKGGIASSESDCRITRVGRFLRKTSLDELPQMFNIITGKMAIIGPRPILEIEFEPFLKNMDYVRRYDAKPGMFCSVDINLRACATRDIQFIMDASYVDNISLKLDAQIFFSIFKTVVLGKNVYRENN